MRTWLVVVAALACGPADACDWVVTRTVDPMTDVPRCMVSSEDAQLAFYREGDGPANVVVVSAYTRTHLKIRVDDNPAIRMGDDYGTRRRGLEALMPQLATGQRIRVEFADYPRTRRGDAQVCNLMELLDAC